MFCLVASVFVYRQLAFPLTLVIDSLMLERDNVERESRDKETKILNLTRQLDELENRISESERIRVQQQRELDGYANNQDDVGKNVRTA